MKHGVWIAVLTAAMALTGCESPEPEPMTGKVSGTIAYRERILLTPEAVVKVSLQDVSLAAAPATELAEQEITSPGQDPIDVELE